MNFPKSRYYLLLGVVLFIGLFQWVYVTWLCPTFGYMGFTYEPLELHDQTLAFILSVLPAMWLPLHIERPSQLICWILYLTVFVPSMYVPLFIGMQELASIRVMMIVLFAGFALINLSHRLPLLKIRALPVSPFAFWVGYWVIFATLLMWVFIVYRGQFQLVALDAVYESLRFSSRETAKGTGVGYAVMWLSGSFVPLLLSWAIIRRHPIMFLTGTAVLVMLYCTGGLKSILISAFIPPLLYVMMRNKRIPFALAFIWAVVVIFAGLNSANLAVVELAPSHFLLSALLFGRTFAGPGLLTAMYQDFFSHHPLTLYSHVKGISAFVDAPYEGGMGREIGYFYSKNLDLNLNAHFWASDGLAALGLPGIVLISLLCALLFWILDSAAARHSPIFSALAVSFVALNISNVSLFTALVSGGFAISILALYLMPKGSSEDLKAPVEQTNLETVGTAVLTDSPRLDPPLLHTSHFQHFERTITWEAGLEQK